MTAIAYDLNASAFKELVEFCSTFLKDGIDPETYADGLVSEATLSSGGVLFEIRGFHTKSGNPVTISFEDDDFLWNEVENV